jgi:phage baseplate assembly protein V
MLVFGIVVEVNAPKGLAKVQFKDMDSIVSPWMPMSMPKTYQDKFSIPYDVNEHVWCMMDPSFEFGVIGGAIYSKNELPAEGSENENVHIAFVYGLSIDYNRAERTLSINGQGKVSIDITGDVDIKCTNAKVEAATKVDLTAPVVNISGNCVVKGTLTAGAIGTSTADGGNGKITVEGDIETTGDVKAGTVSLKTHKHLGVTTGGGISGTPQV